MLTHEMIAQVKKLEIRTRRIVDEFTAGAYHSVFKGKGIEFHDVREYTFEDDFRDIDWNVTARTGRPHVKTFVEDRELNVMILLDVSASTAFGCGIQSKREQIVNIAALLALSAIRNNDRVGMVCFSDQIEHYVPLRSGRRHGLRMIRELMTFSHSYGKTNIANVLSHTLNTLKKRSIVFLLSDMVDDQAYCRELQMMQRRHDCVAIRVLDPAERNWPAEGGFYINDSESGAGGFFHADRKSMMEYTKRASAYISQAEKSCRDARVDLIDIAAGEDILQPLLKFFHQRNGEQS